MPTEMQKRMKQVEDKVDALAPLAKTNLDKISTIMTWLENYLTPEQKESLAKTLAAQELIKNPE